MTGASLSTSDGPRWGHARAYGTAQSGIPAATLRLSFDGVRVVRAGSRGPPPICVALAKLATRQPLFVTRQPLTANRLPPTATHVPSSQQRCAELRRQLDAMRGHYGGERKSDER